MEDSPWLFTPRAEPTISFEGPVAEETFKIANGEEPVEKAFMASLSPAITSEDSVNSNLDILMVDSGASGHYSDDAIIRAQTPSAGLGVPCYAPQDHH